MIEQTLLPRRGGSVKIVPPTRSESRQGVDSALRQEVDDASRFRRRPDRGPGQSGARPSLRAQANGPSHKHYEESPQAEQPSPTGEMAPRLQNLGVHTFPVSTKSKKAQLFMNQGLNLTYGFNHAEAGRAYPRGGAPRPQLRHGLLGTGPRPGAEHQRAHGPDQRAQGPGPGPEGGGR